MRYFTKTDLVAIKELAGDVDITSISGKAHVDNGWGDISIADVQGDNDWVRDGYVAGSYEEDGQLDERIREAFRSRPDAAVQRSLNTRSEKSFRSRIGALDP